MLLMHPVNTFNFLDAFMNYNLLILIIHCNMSKKSFFSDWMLVHIFAINEYMIGKINKHIKIMINNQNNQNR